MLVYVILLCSDCFKVQGHLVPRLCKQVIGSRGGHTIYYIPINDTTLELSVFWPSDTESRINELRFSESISLSSKTRLTSVTCFCGDVT